jgi:phosphatidylglycerol:prolipoprotein diacylglycerol transferase
MEFGVAMRPILFVWRGIVLHSYHVAIYASMLVTVLLTVVFAQADRLNPDRTAIAVLLLIVPGFVVARLFYVARHWDHFRREPARILRRSEGGLSLYGGLFGILAGAVPVLAALDLPFAPFMDAIVLGILGGLIIAKGGCLLNGCCYGHSTDHWCGLDLPDDHGVWRRRFPSQLLEMAWAAGLLLLMLGWRSFSPPSGAIACAVLALQPVGRLFLQKLRDEGAAEDAAVRKTCLAMIMIAVAAALLVWLR